VRRAASFWIIPVAAALGLATFAWLPPAAAAPESGGAGVSPAVAAPALQTPPAASQPSSQPAPLAAYRVAPSTQPGKPVAIGSTDPKSGFMLRAAISPYGAGLYKVDLAQHKDTALGNDPYVILQALPTVKQADGTWAYLYHMAARSVSIDGSPAVDLESQPWDLIPRPGDPTTAIFHIGIQTEDGEPVLDIRRTISVDKGSYDIHFAQHFVNRTGRPLTLVWRQNLQGDIASDGVAYFGDRRAFEAGYHNLAYDPTREHIYVDDASVPRTTVLKAWDATPSRRYWPTAKLPKPYELVWLAASNRYFSAVVHPPAPAQPPVLEMVSDDSQIGMEVYGTKPPTGDDTRSVVLTYSSTNIALATEGKQAQADLELDLFAGPRDPKLFADPPYSTLALSKIIIYNLGGPCSFCTFQWLAEGLLFLLKGVHFVFHDWGVAIIILVLLVRLVLHPLTRRSQISMTKMSKQMAALQPELEKLKKKYKDDSQKLQQEQMQLYREKNVNPVGMLGGCLPMLLQMPIWAALYAMLYYAIELRHQPAFYGVFQAISGGRWHFLGDLSSPDRFIRVFNEPHLINLFIIQFDYSSINIVPILMGLVFFLQQKFATPPAANPEAAKQQKMMSVMTTVLFPLMMYATPSGLTLYIMASTAAGIVDSTIVKRHIKQQEAAGTLFPPPNPNKPKKPGGFWARMQKVAEERQRKLTGEGPKRWKDRD
jgi:YidC/Oxa1 family membrane protein insertase